MKKLGYGKGYKYPHQFDGNYVPETYLPEQLIGRTYYQPSDQGEELAIAQRLEKLHRPLNPAEASKNPQE